MSVARLNISLYFDCPYCDYTLDLFDEKDCPEFGTYNDEIVAWEYVKKWLNDEDMPSIEGTCGICKETFIVKGIEY